MAYAYQDKYGILHVVDDEKIAKESAGGRVVQTDIPHAGGYPQVPNGDEMDSLIVYSYGSAYVGGNEKNGRKVSLSSYPAVQALYQALH
jgi:hypothetical protein